MFTLRWPGMPPMIYFTELNAVREVFAAPAGVLAAGRSNAVLDFIAGPRSVARLDGEEHKQRRRTLTPPFSRLGAGYAAKMRASTVRICQRAGPGPVSFQQLSQSLSLHNLLSCALGVEEGPDRDRLHELVLAFIHDSLNPITAAAWCAFPGVPLREGLVRHLAPFAAVAAGNLVPFVRLAATIEQLDRHLLRLIRKARSPSDGPVERNDVLCLLAAFSEELSDGDLRDELMALLVAGHETTSTTMDWFVVEALQRPDVHARLVAEVDAVVGDDDVTPEHLPRLPYLAAVVQECLRLRPPVPAVGRYVVEDTTIAGVPLRRGQMASVGIAVLQRDPTLWPDPQRFRPERFLEPHERAAQAPFGGGTRTCIGKHFALFQLHVVLAAMLSRFSLTPHRWPTPRQVQRGLFTGVSHPVEVRLQERP